MLNMETRTNEYRQQRVRERNISTEKNKYVCDKCSLEFKKEDCFYSHINIFPSCIQDKIMIGIEEITFIKSIPCKKSKTNGRNIIQCKVCIKSNVLSLGKHGINKLCDKHKNIKVEPEKCKWEKCNNQSIDNEVCQIHFDMFKNLKCPRCKDIYTSKKMLINHVIGVLNCVEIKELQERYKDTIVIIDGKQRRKCEYCDGIFKDLYELKRHENRNTSCIERKQRAEKMSEYLFINDDGKINYQCPRCDKIFDDRHNCERHIDGPRDCNPQYETREINGKTVIFKEKNKYLILENGNLVRLCKHEDCTLCPIDGHHCTEHGGIRKIYKCENIDNVDGECQSNCKVIIDGIHYCIFHGGQPKLKKCENEDCDKLIHSARFCGTHKLVKNIRNKENDKITHKKYYKNNIEKTIVMSSKSSDKKSKRDIEHKDYITEAYIKARIEMSDFICHWCNRTIHQDIGNYDIDQMSFDRLDNSLPHIINNLVVSCLFCNRARNHCSKEEWKEYIDVLRGYRDVDFTNKKFNLNWISEMIGRLKNLDKHKGYEFNLTSNWIKEQFDNNKYSHYTGVEMFPAKSSHYPFQPSIDRIDNSKGHTMDNCVLVCMVENYGRNNMLYEEFKEWLEENFPKKVEKKHIHQNIKIKIKKVPIKVL